jgi:hypothetical protein
MKNRRKILPKIIILALVLVLITAIALSTVYAKYVTNDEIDQTARPAAFELVFKPSDDDGIEVDFALDGEPGAPIGYNKICKNYDFSVKTTNSEVASEFDLKITFNDKVAKRIQQARFNHGYGRFDDGVWCDYRVWMKDSSGAYVLLKGVNNDKVDAGNGGKETLDSNGCVWTKTFTIEPSKNPNGSTGAETMCDFRLEMVFYNNTMLPETDGNGSVTWSDPNYPVVSGPDAQDYFFSSDAIDIQVSSTQIDPNYEGAHMYS